MAIEVGQILDKYELLEEVGQGGMAVVYRGLDRSLRREVAVKVLHRHLAGHKEARDRFEREAHAVAKLRHSNILEIFDFSGSESAESYIVTEFIDGSTLRQFITGYELRHPEIGAMITAQVCRALTHAHGLGILHRDVKPENIMIRQDGVVKLMDFGIAQMIDLQRMTVTGQLLGSPAYMSPEHVEGQPLDFRTDVFSVGILLYQLVTGELPFAGRNPHEILKRIAECRYEPAHRRNPLVGKELERIIDRAMARLPDDRYPDISEMLTALERFLEGSGLTDHNSELAQFFLAPPQYEMALERRLVDHLSRRGRALVEDDRVAALELFNRVLTIDPDNEPVLAEIDRMGSRSRGRRIAMVIAAVILLGGSAYAGVTLLGGGGDGEQVAGVVFDAGVSPPADAAAVVRAATPADAGLTVAEADSLDAAPARITRRRTDIARAIATRQPDAAVEVAPPIAMERRTLVVSPFRGAEYRIDDGPWQKVSGKETSFEAPATAVRIEVKNDSCCQPFTDRLDRTRGSIKAILGFLPATLRLSCARPGVEAQVDKRGRDLGQDISVPIGEHAAGQRSVTISFFDSEGYFRELKRTLKYATTTEVTCPE